MTPQAPKKGTDERNHVNDIPHAVSSTTVENMKDFTCPINPICDKNSSALGPYAQP